MLITIYALVGSLRDYLWNAHWMLGCAKKIHFLA